MEKANLLVRETKRNKIHVEIEFADGKKMPFPQLKLTDTSLNGMGVEVERKAGQIVFVRKGEEVLFSGKTTQQTPRQKKPEDKTSSFSSRKRKGWQYEHVSQVRNQAYAPYNFVPLNREVVEINPEIPDADKYHSDRYTGWIDVKIEAITPLYIRGTLTQEEVEAGKESKDKPDFFAPVNRIRIPGSSLRGVIRNLVEIVSYGKFHFIDKNRRLYYRGLADRSNLREEYQRRMSSHDRRSRRTQYNFSVGVLRRSKSKEKGEHFEIVSSGDKFKQILKKEARKRVQNTGKEYSEFNYYKVDEGYIVVSGDMPNKKRDWLIYNPPNDAEIIQIPNGPDSDVENYLGDRNRNERVPNLIDLARKKPEGVPCFYVRWQDKTGNERISFGHTGMFRLAYEQTIGEHLERLIENEKIDFTEAIFGNEKKHAGRMFFEDAFLSNDQSNPLLSVETPQILSEPKPTTFQHYLVQNSDEVRQLNNYNSDTVIRGYKRYWHKSGENWIETDKEAIEKHSSQYTKIQPVKAGAKFHGRIRFENFSGEELGALLFALDLPEGCAHKLGMGKPLGLGSVQITPALYLSDRQRRYRDFFAEWDNQVEPASKDLTEEFKREFEQYILKKLGEPTDIQLWETERLKELLVMLHVDVGRELERNGLTRYMSIVGQNEFKDRPVLPLPLSISDKKIVQKAINSALGAKEEPKQLIRSIKKITIKGIWESYNVLWEPYPDVNILAGVNGSGKSTLMDIIHAALKHDFNELKTATDLIEISFDTGEILKYRKKDMAVEPTSEIKFDYISTFDKKISAVSFSDSSFRDIYDTELMRELQTKLDQFTRLLNTLLDNPENIEGMKVAHDLQTTLESHINRLLSVREKKVTFCKSFEIDEKGIEELLKSGLPDTLLEALQSMKKRKFIPASAFTAELKELLDDETINRYKDLIFSAGVLSKAQHILFVISDGKTIEPYQLSSGEKQILLILLSVLLQKNNPYILLMDEPEISLHPDWQEELITMIRKINNNVQIILVTHSPALVIYDWFGQIINMEDIFKPEMK